MKYTIVIQELHGHPIDYVELIGIFDTAEEAAEARDNYIKYVLNDDPENEVFEIDHIEALVYVQGIGTYRKRGS